MTIDVEMVKEALNMTGTLAVLYFALDIVVRLLLFAFSNKFVVTITYSWDGITDIKSFGVKAVDEDYAIIKAFKKFASDEPASSAYDLRNIKSYKVTKLK